jgi:membrane AbrB-like protein
MRAAALAQVRSIALTLAIGASGGAIFAHLRLPLAWMIGSMVATTAASLSGLRLDLPPRLRDIMVVVVGVMLGAGFTPALIERIAEWAITLSALFVYVVVATLCLWLYFSKVARFDRVTGYFCSAPGGFSEMVILGGAMGGDERTIALAHTCRVLLVVMTIPLAFRFLGDFKPLESMLPADPTLALDLADVAILTACGILGMWLGRRVRLPAYSLLGPMVLSGLVHLAGLTAAKPPTLLVAAAQVALGAGVGSRFAGLALSRVGQIMGVSLGSTTILLGTTVTFAVGLDLITGIPIPDLILTYAPGGLAEMSLVALALGADTAFVATHHICRIVMVVTIAPLMYKLFDRKPAKAKSAPAED